MVVKLIFIFALLNIDAIVAEDVIRVPKKFTRSRYSHRKTTTTTTEFPLSNYDNSVDMVTDIFSEELLPNKVDDSTTIDPFTTNLSTISVTTSAEDLLNSTDSQVLGTTEEVMEEKNDFGCGKQIDENHPWIAVLIHTDPTGKSRKKTLSKGVLIGERHVLTTVSSLHNSRPFWIVSQIRLGDSPTWGGDQAEVNKSSILHIGIDEIFHHKTRDIALIKLSESVNFTNAIHPICLPENDDFNYSELYLHMCKRSNKYGTSKGTLVTSVLASPLLRQDCAIMLERKKAQLTSDEFCVWDESGDTCTGDLGGPLTAVYNGRYTLVGLNSHINSKVKFLYGDYPGIYVRVGSHLPWIKRIGNLTTSE